MTSNLTSDLMSSLNGIQLLIAVIISIIFIIGQWKLYEKAGFPGWASIIPIYNQYVLIKMATGSGLGLLFCFIPCVGIFYLFYVYYKLALAFGQGTCFAICMIFFTPIFFLILGFGNYQYYGPQ